MLVTGFRAYIEDSFFSTITGFKNYSVNLYVCCKCIKLFFFGSNRTQQSMRNLCINLFIFLNEF